MLPWTSVYKFLFSYTFSSSRYTPRNGIAGSHGNSMSNLFSNGQTFFFQGEGGSGIWTQNLTLPLEPCHHLIFTISFCYFWDRVLTLCPGHHPPICAFMHSWDDGSMPPHQAIGWDKISRTFCLGWLQTTILTISISQNRWDYRLEPLLLALIVRLLCKAALVSSYSKTAVYEGPNFSTCSPTVDSDYSHTSGYKVVSHCDFDLHFSNGY
jgi:hypothetical protein